MSILQATVHGDIFIRDHIKRSSDYWSIGSKLAVFMLSPITGDGRTVDGYNSTWRPVTDIMTPRRHLSRFAAHS